MSSYDVFGQLTSIVTATWVIAACGFFVERARTGTWRAPSTRLFAALMFFSIPAAALFRVLSRPLPEHSAASLWLHVGGVLVWLAAGAASAFRTLRAEQNGVERPIT